MKDNKWIMQAVKVGKTIMQILSADYDAGDKNVWKTLAILLFLAAIVFGFFHQFGGSMILLSFAILFYAEIM